ncbi:hypothetical protein F5Y01DRAFT_320293 [Xylaria sp. FL0043]|nr:hypothetical protein F5Y01DRAFT_320293 [Xylaria sp. FL0043]
MDSTALEIKKHYDAGGPLFTRDAIRRISKHLGAIQGIPPHTSLDINLTGINGYAYQITIGGDHFLRPTGEDLKWVVFYRSIQSLTVHTDRKFRCPESAWLSLGIEACARVLEPPPDEQNRLLKGYKHIEREWEASRAYGKLQKAFSTIKTRVVLDKLIAVALGPLAFGEQQWDPSIIQHAQWQQSTSQHSQWPQLTTQYAHSKQSIIQHALVSAIRSNLLQRGIMSASSKLYVQDRSYTQVDRSVLSSTGFKVVSDPDAFLMLDDSSVLVSIDPCIPVKQIVADICRPAIIIWNKARNDEDSLGFYCTDPTSPRVDKMLKKEYKEFEFPVHESYPDLVMYVRKTAIRK